MVAKNIFYRIPSQRGIRVATLSGAECTLDQFCNYIIDSEGLSENDFIVASGTKVFRPTSCNLQLISLQNNSHVDILIPLLGGKGGFGSLLRAIGAQIEKTTNKDACRDLSGRRLRDIKREEELNKLLALQEKLLEEKESRRKARLEKLRKKSEDSTASKSIQELVSMFDDHAYNRRRMEVGDILEAAIDKGIINFKKRKIDYKLPGTENAEKKSRLENSITTHYSTVEEAEHEENINSPLETAKVGTQKRSEMITKDELEQESSKNSAENKIQPKRKQDYLWLGLEEDL